MSWYDTLKARFPYGQSAWDELCSARDRFCDNVSFCDDSCPLEAVRVEADEIRAAIPDRKFAGEPQLPLCNKFSIFARPEQVASIVGYSLPQRFDDSDPLQSDCEVSFAGLLDAE
jgi:hypothetical protein